MLLDPLDSQDIPRNRRYPVGAEPLAHAGPKTRSPVDPDPQTTGQAHTRDRTHHPGDKEHSEHKGPVFQQGAAHTDAELVFLVATLSLG